MPKTHELPSCMTNPDDPMGAVIVTNFRLGMLSKILDLPDGPKKDIYLARMAREPKEPTQPVQETTLPYPTTN